MAEEIVLIAIWIVVFDAERVLDPNKRIRPRAAFNLFQFPFPLFGQSAPRAHATYIVARLANVGSQAQKTRVHNAPKNVSAITGLGGIM